LEASSTTTVAKQIDLDQLHPTRDEWAQKERESEARPALAFAASL
jgi:hypothetical protein